MIHEYFHGKRVKIIRKFVTGTVEMDIGAGKKRKGKISLDILRKLRPDVVGEVTNLPIRDSIVDSVVCSHVIEHVADPDKALNEINRTLRPGGLAFFFLPDDRSFLWRILEPVWERYYATFVIKEASPSSHVSSFDDESFSRLLRGHFSEVVKQGKLNFGMEIYAVCRK